MYPTILRLCLLVILAGQHVRTERHKTIYEKIQTESNYSTFNQLIRSNTLAIRNLRFSPLTVFIPENQAFDLYDGDIFADLAFYHMTFEIQNLAKLKTTTTVSSVRLENPPLWITNINEEIYVNSAMILKDKSNYVARTRSGDTGQIQVLHMIDQVLDPMIKLPKSPPKASNFLTSDDKWNLGGTKLVTKFYQRVQDNQLLDLFDKNEPGTFFIPVDSGIDPQKYKMMDEKVIRRHMVANHVLFTVPTEKYGIEVTDPDFPFTLTIEKQGDRLFVKRTEDELEEFFADILIPDIPLRNGVLHLISQPLGNFKKVLKPFPYLPIIEKVTNDPETDIFYRMGSLTEFNKKFEMANVNFTYFIPKDSSWVEMRRLGLEPTDSAHDILSRHLVISETPYSMQQLASMSRVNGYNDITLKSEGGPLKVTVLKEDGSYFLKWKKKYIQIVKADYECTNGMVHILSAPMVNFKKHDEYQDVNQKTVGSDYWKIVGEMVN